MGTNSKDHLTGSAGSDTLVGGRGADTMTGGAGADAFKFSPFSGDDVITDFGGNGTHDVLDLSAYKAASIKPALHDVGNNVEITFATGDVITLTGVHAKELIAQSAGFTI